jgi:hypothetical protein
MTLKSPFFFRKTVVWQLWRNSFFFFFFCGVGNGMY